MCNFYQQLCNKYDIVFCEWFELLVPILTHIKDKKFKLIVRLHSYEYFYRQINLNRDSSFNKDVEGKALTMACTDFNKIDKLIIVNDWFKEKISQNFKFNNIVTIPNYYKTFQNKKINSNIRKKHIGIVGINPLVTKGLYDLMLIFENLIEKDNEYKLFIKGGLNKNEGLIPPYIDELDGKKYYKNSIELYEKLINTYPNNIILCKHTNDGGEDMETFYNKIGYLLTASIQESFHCVIMEAGSAGSIPILYENKDFQHLDIARTPNNYRFISFNNIKNIVQYITENNRFEELSLNASEYYNSINTAVKDFENLFYYYNNNICDISFIIPNYDENNLIKYEKQILKNIENKLNKNIEIIVISDNINKSKLISFKTCWVNGYSYRDSSIKLNYNLNMITLNLKQDININFKILIGIKNTYKNTKIINILFDNEIVRVPICNLKKYKKFIENRFNDNSYLRLVNF